MLPPNTEVFTSSRNDVLQGRTASRDENGVWRNALGLESSVKHRHVAKIWQDKCIPFQTFYEQVQRDERTTTDHVQPASYLQGLQDDLTFPDGARLSTVALRQLARHLGLPASIGEIAEIEAGAYARQLAEILRSQMTTKFASDAKIFTRYRTDKDGENQVRALFKGTNAPLIDNVEMLEMLREAFPAEFRNAEGWGNALASHIEDNVDTIRGNVIFPDYMKHQPDSDYGVGVQFRNSEVATGSLSVMPFLFRAICLNGCIWGRRNGSVQIALSSDGVVDRPAVRQKIKDLVEIALSEGNDLLTLMGYTYELPVPETESVIAYLAQKHNLTQEMSRTWFTGYRIETINEGNGFRKTAFGIIQGLTRAAQMWTGDQRQQMESTASALVAKSLQDDIDSIARRWATYNTEAESISEASIQSWVIAGTTRS